MTQYFDPFFQAEDSSGAPIAGAKLQFFETITTTPKDTFTDSSFGTPNANPVIADGFGRFGPIFLDISSVLYTVILKDADDVVIDSQDGVGGASDTVGDVVGPASSTDNAIARWDSTTGKLLQNSSATVGDDGSIIPGAFIGSLKGGDIASANPLVVDTDGDMFDVTGTTNFATMTVATNRTFQLQFDGILTVTNGASMILPSGANITTAAGDVWWCRSTAADTVLVMMVTKADGTPIVSSGGFTLGTEITASAQAAMTFTGIPAGTTQIDIMFEGISMANSQTILVQIGDAGGIETSGYIATAGAIDGAASNLEDVTTGFNIRVGDSSAVTSGVFSLYLKDSANFTWAGAHAMKYESIVVGCGGGFKSLSAELTQVSITSASSNFDLGSINIKFI